ncbi:molybdate ABC transporter permease subunit [Actinotalea sp. M2MS4P-6]|uniref:molybdate ABC transporter permease subunit n=1 Tax=Actinotalea sp. M2MS4P-6 TaxID=2983762 RepID=UPI00398C28AC
MVETGVARSPGPRPVGTARRPRERTSVGLALLAGTGLVFVVAPFVALLLGAPWGRLLGLAVSGPALEALWLSLRTATAATALCLVLGVPLAWALARTTLPCRGVVRSVVTVPMVLPPVVGGVALLALLGRRGLVGRHLDAWLGVSIPFTTGAVVIAEAFVAMPFLVLSVDGALRSADVSLERAAATLGASRWYVFRRVTLPLVGPGVVAGAVLCFARAMGEFGATVTFAGSLPGVTRTMPLAIYLAMESDPELAVALSLVLIVTSVAVLVALRSRWLRPSGGPS